MLDMSKVGTDSKMDSVKKLARSERTIPNFATFVRKGKTAPIRQDILDAAAKVFGNRGYESATLEEVATVVGIQKGSLYYHIESKEQLLLEIHEQLKSVLFQRIHADVAAAKGDPIIEMKAIVTAIVETISANLDKAKVCLRDYRALSTKNVNVVLQNRDYLLDMIEGVIGRLVANGNGRVASAWVAAQGILGMAYWIIEWFDEKRDSGEQVSEVLSAMVINGLRAKR